jgi:hypothetical protein
MLRIGVLHAKNGDRRSPMPLPATRCERGREGKGTLVPAMQMHPSFAQATARKPPKKSKKGGGAPEGASDNGPRHSLERYRPNGLRAQTRATDDCPCGHRPPWARSPFSAPPRLLSRLPNAKDSAQAALHADRRAQALPAPLTALKPSTWRAGRRAGGDDARTARERSG